MMHNTLVLIYGAAVLLFGFFLSAAFTGVNLNRHNIKTIFVFCAFSGMLQLVSQMLWGEDMVYKLYPVLTHMPVLFMLCRVYNKRLFASIAAVCTAYMCCHPSKWTGLFMFYITDSAEVYEAVRIAVLLIIFMPLLRYAAPFLSDLFSQDRKSVYVLGAAPMIYYLYDYATVVYTDLLKNNVLIATEFMPFLLLVVFLVLGFANNREYQQKIEALSKEHAIQVVVDEQQKELEVVKRSEQEIRILRHDMRMLLGNIMLCVENDDKMTAKKLISAYVESIDLTVVKKYCSNTTLNYIISGFAAKCKELQTEFDCRLNFDAISCDEIVFSTIISNALDNAVNAQKLMPEEKRRISLNIRKQNDKLLVSVKNPVAEMPEFSDGLPVSAEKGHGYGSQSIRYLTEKLGGNCQFSCSDNIFVLRIVI